MAIKQSGVVGVTWRRRERKWQACIVRKGQKHYLGLYENVNEAIKARKKAEKELPKDGRINNGSQKKKLRRWSKEETEKLAKLASQLPTGLTVRDRARALASKLDNRTVAAIQNRLYIIGSLKKTEREASAIKRQSQKNGAQAIRENLKSKYRAGNQVKIKHLQNLRTRVYGEKKQGVVVELYDRFMLVNFGCYKESFLYADMATGRVDVRAI